jgi:hypothetical protein
VVAGLKITPWLVLLFMITRSDPTRSSMRITTEDCL